MSPMKKPPADQYVPADDLVFELAGTRYNRVRRPTKGPLLRGPQPEQQWSWVTVWTGSGTTWDPNGNVIKKDRGGGSNTVASFRFVGDAEVFIKASKIAAQNERLRERVKTLTAQVRKLKGRK